MHNLLMLANWCTLNLDQTQCNLHLLSINICTAWPHLDDQWSPGYQQGTWRERKWSPVARMLQHKMHIWRCYYQLVKERKLKVWYIYRSTLISTSCSRKIWQTQKNLSSANCRVDHGIHTDADYSGGTVELSTFLLTPLQIQVQCNKWGLPITL